MMNSHDFRKYAHQFVDWMADYLENIDQRPVKPNLKPHSIYQKIPDLPPQKSQSMQEIFDDFRNIVMPGVTHWQSPNFFAYFPANASYPSVLAEMLTATLGAQCMIWETSPAAAELEEKMMKWLIALLGLPEKFTGVIQDTASTATLTAILTAREQATGWKCNRSGFDGRQRFRIYCSNQAHSSIDKAVAIAGFGKENLVKIDVDDKLRMSSLHLKRAIQKDIASGFSPLCVIATLGTTSTTAIDPLSAIARVCKEFSLWLHVDAAFAGTALALPEYRWMIEGVDNIDSFVFNPHKWMFTNFDCSAYFVRNKDILIKTFEILPEYLKTGMRGKVNDYRDWGIQLGRRFRALKLWFVLRNFGVEGIQERLREHIRLASLVADRVMHAANFEMMTERTLNLVCFRYHPVEISDEAQLDRLNELLLSKLNEGGKLYLTHTRVKGQYSLRLVIGQTYVQRLHVEKAWQTILETSKSFQL